jgi:hypothetical protein
VAPQRVHVLARHEPITAATEIPAGFKNTPANTVVLGLPIEVVTLDFSSGLRVREIRARQVASHIWLQFLPGAMAQPFKHDKPFQLAQVQTDADGQIDVIHIAPITRPQDFPPPHYRLTADAVEPFLADDSSRIRFAPTAAAPMRFELLALFELCGVELSPQIDVQHLLLKMRDKRVRATLRPEAIHVGATFTIAHLSLTRSGTIEEIRLIAV